MGHPDAEVAAVADRAAKIMGNAAMHKLDSGLSVHRATASKRVDAKMPAEWIMETIFRAEQRSLTP
jgi:hypothetical protein